MTMLSIRLLHPPFMAGPHAQPNRPDHSVVFVHDATGSPMPGAYANPIAVQDWLSKPNALAWTVQLHFTVGEDYPYSPHEIGTSKLWTLNGDTVRDGRRIHLRFWGQVMLTGACGGIMPLMAMEVVGNSGWEEVVPMPQAQLDCGPLSE